MREVEASQFVQTYPQRIAGTLSPDSVLEAEGSFSIRDIEADGDRITVGRYGVELVFEFDTREDGIEYDQVEGPLETLRTTLTYENENEGTRLTARSEIAAPGPGVLDRIAAWKRRGELRRALREIAEEYR